MHDRAGSGLEFEGLQPVSHVGLVLEVVILLLMVCTVLLLMVCTVMLMRSLCNKGQARRPSSESQTDKKHPARLRAGLLHANDCVENERPRRSSLRSDRSPGASDRARTGDLLSSDERLRKSGSRSDRRLGARGGVSDGVLSSDERLGASGLRSARRPDQTRTAEKIGGGRRARGAALLGIMVKAVAEEHAAEKELGLEANQQGEGLPPAAAAERDASIGTLELSRDDNTSIGAPAGPGGGMLVIVAGLAVVVAAVTFSVMKRK